MIRYQKIIIFFSFIIIFLVGSLAWVIQSRIVKEIQAELGQSLGAVLETSHQAVKSWIKQHKATVSIWANTAEIRQAASTLLSISHDRSNLLASDAQARLRSWFRPLQQATGYQGYFIIGPDNITLASSRDQNIGVNNLLNKQEQFLQRVWSGETAISLPVKSDVTLLDREGQLREGHPSMFVGAPIFNDAGKVIAIFTFRINPEEGFTTLLQKGRIGQTGETYAFDAQGRLISNSRFDDQLSSIGLISPHEHGILNIELRDPGVNLLQGETSEVSRTQQSFTRMAASAIAGESASDLAGYRDYRGVSVIGAWLWDDELGFGIATELDTNEAYQTLRATRYTILTSTLLLIFLSIGITIIYLNNRARKHAQQALEEGEVRLGNFFQASFEGIFLHDDGKILDVNPATITVFGYDPKETIGRNILEFVAPESRQVVMTNMAAGHEGPYEVGIVAKDGSTIPVEVRAKTMERHGKQIRVVGLRDITERKQAEEALRESEQYNRMLFEESTIGLALCRMNGELVDLNPAYAQILGRTIEETLQLSYWDITPEKYAAEEQALLKCLEQTGSYGPYEKEYIHADGHLIPVQLSGLILERGGEKFIWSSVEDISERKQAEEALRKGHDELEMRVQERTAELAQKNEELKTEIIERKRAEEELRENEKKLRLITDNIPAFISYLDKDLRYRFNNKAYEWFGVAPEELYGKHLSEVHSEAAYPKMKERLEVALLGKAITFDNLISNKNGEECYISGVHIPDFAEDGEVKGIYVFANDITERKRVEEELRESELTLSAIFEQAAVGVAMIESRNGKFLRINKKYCDIAGYTPEEMQSLNFMVITHPDDLQEDLDNMQLLLDGKIREFSMEKRYLRKDGSVVWVNLAVSPMWKTGEQPDYHIAVVEDITERKRAEEQARQHQAELAHMARLNTMGEMATGLAHELNQPLSAISTYAGVALRMLDSGIKRPELLAETIEGTRNQAHRASEIIRRLRQFISKHTPQKTSFNLNTIVEEVVNFTDAERRKQGVELQLELAEDLPLISADYIQIEQVLVNLINNSLDAMDLAVSKARQIAIQTYLNEEGMVQAEVADTGRGMDAETLSHIFESFVSTKGEKGMGMGLSISRSIIEAHGGRLWAESKPGHGATFYFTLPVDSN